MVLIVGAVIGAIAGALTSKGHHGLDCEYRCRLVGSFIEEKILVAGSSRSRYGNCAINYWAVILVAVVSFFFGRKNS